MNKKWLKRGLILGGFVIFVLALAELFLIDFAAEKRYLNDKKLTLENFVHQEELFNKIHQLSKRSPSFDLTISKSDSVFLFLNYSDYSFLGIDSSNDSLRTIIDTFFNKKNWIVQTTDADFYLTQNYGDKHFSQFEEIYQLAKQINGIRISNKKDIRLDIYYKTILSNGFRYSSFYSEKFENLMNEEDFVGKKLNEHFYWNYFDENTICFLHPPWIVPNSEFE